MRYEGGLYVPDLREQILLSRSHQEDAMLSEPQNRIDFQDTLNHLCHQ
jgi:hypothetical protein